MREYLRYCRHHFIYAGGFSFFINVLLLTVPLFMLQVFDRVLVSESQETLLILALLATGALVVHLLLDILRSHLLLAAGVELDSLVGPPVLASLLKSAVRPSKNDYKDGLRDVAILRGFLAGGSIAALFDSPWVPVYVGVIFLLHPYLGLIASGGAVALFILAYLNERLCRRPLTELQDRATHASGYIDASMRNAEIVYALGMLTALRDRWERLHAKVMDKQVQVGRYSSIFGSLSKFIRLFVQVIILTVAAELVIDQQMTAGVMMAGTLLLARALAPVESAIASWKGLVEAREAYRRLNELLANYPSVKRSITLPASQGRLELERVVYANPGSDRPILKGVSFVLQPGTVLGIIGPSASGKSTLARLITGIWQAHSGAVRLDGTNVAQWPRDQLGPQIGYLPQDVELFTGTVAENIARLQDTSDEEIILAAKRALVHEMILRLPHGYDTMLGAGGLGLSGGQRQRIALARALFGNPRLVVLDEPNASLDKRGDQALHRAIRRMRKSTVTLIVISHRASLLSEVDHLLMLQDGQVSHFGPRDEVLMRLHQAGQVQATPYVIHGGKS